MSSRSAAKKLAKPQKPAAKAGSKSARAKPPKKPLARVTKLTQPPPVKPPPAPVVAKPAPLPPPPVPPRPPFMGLRPSVPPPRPAAPVAQAARPPSAPAVRPPVPPAPRAPLGKPIAPPPVATRTPPPATAPARRPMPGPPAAPPRAGTLPVTPARQSLARSFYWSELRVGDDLPPLSKPLVDRVQVARYAGAAGDFNRLYLDDPFAHSLGFPGTFAPGTLAMGFVGQLLTAWLRRGHVRRLSARFVKIVWPGDELVCHGRIAELRKESGACYADVELWAENQKGELVLRGQATCELYESPSASSSDGSGLLFSFDHPRATVPARPTTPPHKGASRPASRPPPPLPPASPRKK